MTERTRQGLAILVAALILGVAADVLSRTVPARLNTVLGLAAFVLVLLALMQTGAVRLPGKFAPLGAPLALLGVALIWRDSPVLFGLNLLGIATVAALA
jgi:Flp pilus assembly protein protease CpaA